MGIKKVIIEYDDSIKFIEGQEAERWDNHNDVICGLAQLHNCNPFEKTPIKWNIIKDSTQHNTGKLEVSIVEYIFNQYTRGLITIEKTVDLLNEEVTKCRRGWFILFYNYLVNNRVIRKDRIGKQFRWVDNFIEGGKYKEDNIIPDYDPSSTIEREK